MARKISIACEDYDWLTPLIQGDVSSESLEVEAIPITAGGTRHNRAMSGEYDVAEFSLARYIAGWPDWEFVSLPVFPRRFLPQSRMIVNSAADIESPKDLEGKVVGIQAWQNTCALWARGILSEYYDVDLSKVEWVTTRDEPLPMDRDAEFGRIGRDALVAGVADGRLDALILSKAGELYPLPAGTQRLFTDLKSAEREFFEATGMYPPMHNFVVQDHLAADHPWLLEELFSLFEQSYEIFSNRARYEAKYPLVWWQLYREEEQAIFGDIWERSLGLEGNEDELASLVTYAHEQGIIDREFAVKTLFESV
jgi:4,5-dihydroxyphthalate decarboxylase